MKKAYIQVELSVIQALAQVYDIYNSITIIINTLVLEISLHSPHAMRTFDV